MRLGFSVLVCMLIGLWWLWRFPEPALWADGHFYVAAAEHHADGEVMRNVVHDGFYREDVYTSGAHFTLWAPGYSWLLARGMQTGLTWQQVGAGLHAGAMALVCGALLFGVRRYPAWVQVATVMAWVLMPGLIVVSRHIFSDLVMMVPLAWVVALDE